MEDKKVIGYTTGVFDLFHIGHLNILKSAKEHCDYLIVGVSTDELTQEYKNRSPVIPFEERMEIIRAIKYVDQVVPQISMDKYLAWESLHYDVLFHGDDWKETSLYRDMQEKLEKVGVKCIYFSYTKGTSSTKIKEFIEQYKNKH